jgi:hypothetical protein
MLWRPQIKGTASQCVLALFYYLLVAYVPVLLNHKLAWRYITAHFTTTGGHPVVAYPL